MLVNVHGNSATATKLQTTRTIALTGDVTGSASFNGSANATITTNLANVVLLTGTMSNGSININYPSGYNKDNCVVISSMLKRTGVASTRGYASGSTFLPDDKATGFLVSRVELQTSNIVLHGRALYLSSDNQYMDMGVDFNVYYRIMLMKI